MKNPRHTILEYRGQLIDLTDDGICFFRGAEYPNLWLCKLAVDVYAFSRIKLGV